MPAGAAHSPAPGPEVSLLSTPTRPGDGLGPARFVVPGRLAGCRAAARPPRPQSVEGDREQSPPDVAVLGVGGRGPCRPNSSISQATSRAVTSGRSPPPRFPRPQASPRACDCAGSSSSGARAPVPGAAQVVSGAGGGFAG